ERWFGPMAAVRWGSAVWHTLAWAIFGAGYVGAIVFVSSVLRAQAGDVLLVLAAGARLSMYVGATVGEIGFLRGIWMDGSRRLAAGAHLDGGVARQAGRGVPGLLPLRVPRAADGGTRRRAAAGRPAGGLARAGARRRRRRGVGDARRSGNAARADLAGGGRGV